MAASRVGDTDTTPDRVLLERGVAGDQQAFADLMRRHEGRIFSLALRMMGDRSDALDATQDAFVSAFRKGHTYTGDAAFSTWLYRVAINACKDLLRKRARLPSPVEELQERPTSGAPGFDEAVTLRLSLRDALARLPDGYREAVVMHDLGGIPYEEIAAITDSALGTVKSRISRGRKQLAEILEQAQPDRPSKTQRPDTQGMQVGAEEADD